MNKIFNIECRHRFWQNKLWYIDAHIDFQKILLYNKIYQIKQLLKWICRRENFSVLLIYSHICKVNKNILVLFNKKNLKTDIESIPFSLPDIKKNYVSLPRYLNYFHLQNLNWKLFNINLNLSVKIKINPDLFFSLLEKESTYIQTYIHGCLASYS